ncbi:hypothetical protein BDV96DRAFT_679673, partial [Lophiotrema nucula]
MSSMKNEVTVLKMAPPPRPSTAALQGFITVNVGPNGIEYQLYRALLSHHSGYFRGVLSPQSSFKETTDGVITLSNADTTAFEFTVDWMYTQKLPSGSLEWFEAAGGELMKLIHYRIYILADYLIIPQLKEAIFNYIFEIRMWCRPRPSNILLAHENLPEGDPLLKFQVDAEALILKKGFHPKDEEGRASMAQLPPKFLVAVMVKMQKLMTIKDASWSSLRREDYSFDVSED